MKNGRIKRSLEFAFIVLLFSVLSDVACAQTSREIIILDASVNSADSLIINGGNFRAGTPTVTLDGQVLPVSSSTDTRIIAQVPGVLPPGTHLLTVSIDPERRIITGLNLEIGLNEPSEPRKILTAAHLRTSGMAAYSRGQYAAARILFERAVTLAVRQNDSYLAALTHNSLGAIDQDECKFKEAVQEFEKAVDILRSQPEHTHALATTLANFAAALSRARREHDALVALAEASKLLRHGRSTDPQLQMHILNVLATVYFQKGQAKKAEKLLVGALKIRLSPDAAVIPETADVAHNLATIYAIRGDYPKAVASYTRALAIAEEKLGPSHPIIATFLQNIGYAYLRMGQYEEAEARYIRSLNILEEHGLMESQMGLNTLYALSQVSMKKNELKQAEHLLARAVGTGNNIRARTPEMVETLELYGTVLRSLSKSSEADNVDREAIRIRAELAFTTPLRGGSN